MEVMAVRGRVANWNTMLGYELYLSGRPYGEIADACGVQISTIASYARRHWRKGPDGGREAPLKGRRKEATGNGPLSQQADSSPTLRAGEPVEDTHISHDIAGGGAVTASPSREKPLENESREEVTEMDKEQNEEQKLDTARMMEVIAKTTQGMGGIKAVCVGNIIQHLWNLNGVDDIRNARNILDWMEENYDFG